MRRATGRLLPLLERYPLPLHAVSPERKHVPAKARAFLEFIDRKLGGEPPPTKSLFKVSRARARQGERR